MHKEEFNGVKSRDLDGIRKCHSGDSISMVMLMKDFDYQISAPPNREHSICKKTWEKITQGSGFTFVVVITGMQI
jgi:hypothetical protein